MDTPYDNTALKPSVRSILQSEVAVSKMLDFFTTMVDADELLAKAGIERHRLRTLTQDDEVFQCIDTREDAIHATQWRIESNTTRAGRWLTDILRDHVPDLLHGYMDAIWYGYSVQEVIYQFKDGRYSIDRAVLKPMQWFDIGSDGRVIFNSETGASIPCDPRKFLVARNRPRYENPRGEALLSRLYFPVTWRREGWGMWIHFLQTFGDPIIIGQVPNYRDFITAMQKQGVRSAVAWQSVSDTDRVQTINASTPGEFSALENAIIRRVQRLILGQTMTSDVPASGGSYAAAAIGNQVRKEKVASDITRMTRYMQSLLDILCNLNGFSPHRFIMADANGLETARAARDSVLSPVLTASGLRMTKSYFHDVYDYRDQDLEPIPADEEQGGMEPVEQVEDPSQTMRPVRGKSMADDKPIGQLD